MPDRSISFPFGNAYIIGSPNIDRFSEQLYAEQKQRELMRQRQAQMMDNEFSKNVANIRDADVDDVTKKYGDWKLANQQLMRKKGGATPQDQLEVLRKKAEIAKIINASKTAKQEEEELAKQVLSKPDDFDDRASELLTIRRRLPLGRFSEYKEPTADGKEKSYNLADLNTYRYKGTDTDFSKIEREAIGQPKTSYTEPLKPDATDPFTLTGKTYTYANTPEQFYENYLGALAIRKAGRDAEAIASKIPADLYATVEEKFKAIPVETWQRMGVDKPQELVITPEDSKAQILAKHKAQLYALNNQPKEGKPEFRRNEKAIFDAQAAKERDMAKLRHGLAVALKKTPGAKPEGSEDDSLYLEEYLDSAAEKAIREGNEVMGDVLRGGEFVMDVDPVIAKAFVRQGIEPETITVNKKGEYTPIYYEYKKDGTKAIIPELSRPMSRAQALLSLGVKATTGNQRYKEGKSAVKEKPKSEDLRSKYGY